ncbi:hypothetical protein HD806DRAFT_517345 [Xylariaceae sp. AK1471]|nr:hypothetical protein HD806DRAFT_517345 [Xylariaceae sp. AK1471]
MAFRTSSTILVPSNGFHLPSDTSPTSARSETSGTSDITSRSSAPLITHAAPNPGLPSVDEPEDEQENEQEDRHEGWDLLAQVMVQRPDFQAFSRFQDLNVKNLLYYQIELETLREDLKEGVQRDWRKLGPDSVKYADRLVINKSSSAQWKQIEKLRRLLREYNEALVLYSQISALPVPNPANMEQLTKWIEAPALGNFCIGGDGSSAWGKPSENPTLRPSLRYLCYKAMTSLIPFGKTRQSDIRADLVVPTPLRDIDRVTRWVKDEVIPIVHRLKGNDSVQEETELGTRGIEDGPSSTEKSSERKLQEDERIRNVKPYPDSITLKITSGLSTVVACLLPTIAIGVLTTANTTLQKILYIGGFSAIFAIAIMLFTPNTPRLQIFTATAAFSAVLVVFIQRQQ